MYYLYNSNGSFVGAYSFKPNVSDDITCVETDMSYNYPTQLVDGQIVPIQQPQEPTVQTVDDTTKMTAFDKATGLTEQDLLQAIIDLQTQLNNINGVTPSDTEEEPLLDTSGGSFDLDNLDLSDQEL